MGRPHGVFSAAVAATAVLALVSDAFAWGPGTHVELASGILTNLWLLPAGIAALIAKHRKYFLYGNVATDTVFAKKMSKVKQVCHQWKTGFGLLAAAETDAGRAFAHGYLAHLAADTVAHNKFLPRQMAVSRSTVSFGHLYWEIRADAHVDGPQWQQLEDTLRARYPEPEQLLEAHLRETMLSFRTNQALFRRMNLLACERGWRKSVDFWSRLSRFSLDPEMLALYHAECLDRVLDVFSRGRASAVLHEDPCGNAALGCAKAQRRQMRQMRRAGMALHDIVREAAAGHAPQPRGGNGTTSGPKELVIDVPSA